MQKLDVWLEYGVNELCRVKVLVRIAKALESAPRYVHTEAYMRLPEGVQVPRLDECAPILVWNASFWAASMYTSGYAAKADRLEISCEAWGVCCS